MVRFVLNWSILLSILLLQITIASAQDFTSPRATALNSYVAVSDDVFGLDWNVSGLAFSQATMEMSFTKRNFEGSSIRNFGLLFKFRHRHVFSIRKTPEFQTFVSLNKTPIAETPEEVTFYDLLSFTVSEQDWAFGYAFKLSPRLSVGSEARRYRFGTSLLGFFSSSRYWSFGFGATYIFNNRLRIGLVSRNIFFNHYKKNRDRIILQFEGEPDVRVLPLDLSKLPYVVTEPERRLDLGLAARPIEHLLFSFDFYSNRGVGAGLEWAVLKGLYLRQGFSHKKDGLFQPENVSAWSSGAGLSYGTARFDVAFYWKRGDRDSIFESLPNGALEVRPTPGGDRIWLFSALFFVK